MLTSPSSRYELRMNVNQQTPMASPYGPPQPGYGQPSYAPLGGSYPGPYGPYNGPATAYQPGAPPQGKSLSFLNPNSPLLSRKGLCLCFSPSSHELAYILQGQTCLCPSFSEPIAKSTPCLSHHCFLAARVCLDVVDCSVTASTTIGILVAPTDVCVWTCVNKHIMRVCVPPFPLAFCISIPASVHGVSLLSCLSGYSPYASFPSKAVAANPVSDLSSPLDLGNCSLSLSLRRPSPLPTCFYSLLIIWLRAMVPMAHLKFKI